MEYKFVETKYKKIIYNEKNKVFEFSGSWYGFFYRL